MSVIHKHYFLHQWLENLLVQQCWEGKMHSCWTWEFNWKHCCLKYNIQVNKVYSFVSCWTLSGLCWITDWKWRMLAGQCGNAKPVITWVWCSFWLYGKSPLPLFKYGTKSLETLMHYRKKTSNHLCARDWQQWGQKTSLLTGNCPQVARKCNFRVNRRATVQRELE